MQEDDDDKAYIHNHLRFTILYHRDIETDLSRIVGFEVEPFSVQHKVSKWPSPWQAGHIVSSQGLVRALLG